MKTILVILILYFAGDNKFLQHEKRCLENKDYEFLNSAIPYFLDGKKAIVADSTEKHKFLDPAERDSAGIHYLEYNLFLKTVKGKYKIDKERLGFLGQDTDKNSYYVEFSKPYFFNDSTVTIYIGVQKAPLVGDGSMYIFGFNTIENKWKVLHKFRRWVS